MKIKTKLIFGTLLLVFFAVGIVSVVANNMSKENAEETVSQLSRAKLSSTLEAKKTHIEQYLNNLRNQVQLMALEQNTDSSHYHFSSMFDVFAMSSKLTLDMKNTVKEYYQKEFLLPYNRKNVQTGLSKEAYFRNFTEKQWLLQYYYISTNPYSIGEKYKLNMPEKEYSTYSSGHQGYHEVFQRYAEKLGYGDVYLINLNGEVVYSMNKGFELATSVVNGPFADSGLARVFKSALKLGKGEVVIEDFSQYAPLLGAPAAFLASPLVNDEGVVGVFVVQLPIDVVDSIMTNNNQWKKVGLGNTGETYLVGSDFTLRNTSRLQFEEPQRYIETLKEFNDSHPQPIGDIIASGTSIGLQKIVTASTKKALSGNSGFHVIQQYDGRSVLSAYSPINAKGFNWAVISEIDHAEAFESAESFSSHLSASLAMIAVGIIVIAIGVIVFLAQIIFKPLNMITHRMHEIASGDGSLKNRLDDSGADEIADFAKGFNSFVSKLDYIVEQVASTSSLLLSQSANLSSLSKKGKDKSLQQQDSMKQIVSSIRDITFNINQNTEYANSTSDAAVVANEKANAGKDATDEAVSAIETVSTEVNATSEALKELESDSNNIAEVLSVINDISNQTNLLALNAAIEAARAGENGRGFAVVADEVRSLSHRIQTETHTISETISNLQTGTIDAVTIMQQSAVKSKSGVDLALEAGKTLDMVVKSSREINKMNEKIANATQEQKIIIESINSNIGHANEIAEESANSSLAIDDIGSKISSLANEMQGLVSQFSEERIPKG
ncbi:MAG: methyl-accepting chemotaxis protein [Cellvibrionaceae bacterium]